MLRLLAGFIVQTLIFCLILIGPAWVWTGSVGWSRGWLTVGCIVASSLIGGLFLQATNPNIVRERTDVSLPKTAADRGATTLIALAVVAWCSFATWDALRAQLVIVDSGLSLLLGAIVFFLSVIVIGWTFHVNAFASPVVKIQRDREHRVIDYGPYRIVRHPMYFGTVLFFVGIGLLLGSAAGAILAPLVFVMALLPRMISEERTLANELVGYEIYQKRVRFRILPYLL